MISTRMCSSAVGWEYATLSIPDGGGRTLLHHGPARGKGDTSTGKEMLNQGVHPAHQLPFIHVARGVIFADDPTIHNDRMDAATIRVVHQRVDRVEERPP